MPLMVEDFCTSSGVTAEITARPTKFTSLTLVGLVHLFSTFFCFWNLGHLDFALLFPLWSAMKLDINGYWNFYCMCLFDLFVSWLMLYRVLTFFFFKLSFIYFLFNFTGTLAIQCGHCLCFIPCDKFSVKHTWSQPLMKGIPPASRDSHSCTLVGNNLFVFGGTDGLRPLKDLHILDIGESSFCCLQCMSLLAKFINPCWLRKPRVHIFGQSWTICLCAL